MFKKMNSKRLLLLGIIITGCVPVTVANTGFTAGGLLAAFSDTSVVVDNTLQSNSSISSDAGKILSSSAAINTKTNAQKGFNDLFLASSSDESNGSRLNPRAVSFVQDY